MFATISGFPIVETVGAPPTESDASDLDDNYYPRIKTNNETQNEAIYTIVEHSKKDFGYIDLTGKFPFVLARGN